MSSVQTRMCPLTLRRAAATRERFTAARDEPSVAGTCKPWNGILCSLYISTRHHICYREHIDIPGTYTTAILQPQHAGHFEIGSVIL